jgi:hypothetical protein
LEESLVDQALAAIGEAFSKKFGPTPPERLVKAISEIVNLPKEDWSLSFIRLMADGLSGLSDAMHPGGEARCPSPRLYFNPPHLSVQ